MVVPNENIAGMEFWRKLWRDLIPHAAYDILKWLFFLVVAAVIAAVVASIQHFRHAPGQDLFGDVILALLIFCSLLMTVIFFSGSRKREASLQPATIPTEAALVEEKQPEASKEVDIFTERQQLHFKASPGEYMYRIFMKLKLTNRGPASATVAKWDLWVSVGEEHTHIESLGLLPANLAVRRLEFQMIGTGKESFEQLEPNLGEQVDRLPLIRGTPQVGWVCFNVPAWSGLEPAINARLVLQMTDSLGGTHFHIREPENFKKDGEIVEH
jgi:hypothetical protein